MTSSLPWKRSTTELLGLMVQGEGVEPPKALCRQIYSLLRLTTSLPLHIARLEPMEGIEPTTCGLQNRRSSQLSYIGNASFTTVKWY